MPRTQLPKVHTQEQLHALVHAPSSMGRIGLRDRAILSLLSTCGLRAAELCALRVCDVGPELVFVRNGKGGRQRFVPLVALTALAVRRYILAHPAAPGEALFRSLYGAPLTRRQLHKICSRYMRPLGLRGPAVHSLRSSAATSWLDKGIRLTSAQAALGHKNLATTSIYIATATRSLVREFRAAYAPVEAPSPAGPAPAGR